MIHATEGKLHWNYFIALERDLELASRYVEFSKRNFDTYSIEFAHLLFAAASEVDVIAKLLCRRLKPAAKRENINHYRAVILAAFPYFDKLRVSVPRYGLTLQPWENWTKETKLNPFWWQCYNNVKHERDIHFHEATLKNVLNALSALLILTHVHYSYELAQGAAHPRLLPLDTTHALQPELTLFHFAGDRFYKYV